MIRVELCANQGGPLEWGQEVRCRNEATRAVTSPGSRYPRKFCASCARELQRRGRREGFAVRTASLDWIVLRPVTDDDVAAAVKGLTS